LTAAAVARGHGRGFGSRMLASVMSTPAQGGGGTPQQYARKCFGWAMAPEYVSRAGMHPAQTVR